MSRVYDKPIEIQIIDELTEEWTTVYRVRARINKAKTNSEYLNAGATQNKVALTFEIRYFSNLEKLKYDTQSYRILYQGVSFNIEDYDDYLLQHKTVTLLGVSY